MAGHANLPAVLPYVTDLDAPILKLTDRDRLTLGELMTGTQIFGGTGSGKSSGVGRTLATALLRSGAGGLVLCAKPEEAETWLHYAREAGRLQSVIHVSSGSPWRFNFLDYLLRKDGIEAASNAVDVLMRAAEASRHAKDRPGGEGDAFWSNAAYQLLSNSILALFSAYGRITTDELYRFLATAPQSEAQMMEAGWQQQSFCYATLNRADKAPVHRLEERELLQMVHYWRFDFARLDPKTRGNILITVTSLLARFLRGRLHDLLCTHTTFLPDMCFEGAILLLDLPVKTWQEDGIIAQHIIKYQWQRAAEARMARQRDRVHRPLFLFADESQFFINSYDAEFQSTARSSRVATVYLTQSLPTYYAKIGGAHPEHYANMLLANLTNQVFLANGCHITNRYAADQIGQRVVERRGYSRGESYNDSIGTNTGSQRGTSTSWNSGSSWNSGPQGGSSGGSFSRGGGESAGRSRGRSEGETFGLSGGFSVSEQKDYKLDPDTFASKLRTGGRASGGRVEGVWFRAGRRFEQTGSTWAFTTFLQEGGR